MQTAIDNMIASCCLDEGRTGKVNETLMAVRAIDPSMRLRDVRGWLQRHPLDDARFAEATNLIARYPEHPLRTLDALHLTMAADLGVSILATADGVMADAAMSMGMQVVRF